MIALCFSLGQAWSQATVLEPRWQGSLARPGHWTSIGMVDAQLAIAGSGKARRLISAFRTTFQLSIINHLGIPDSRWSGLVVIPNADERPFVQSSRPDVVATPVAREGAFSLAATIASR